MNFNTSGTAGAKIIQLSSHPKHPTHEGQPKHCSVCGKYFIWPLVSATCRDERSERCRDCNIDAIRPRSLLGGRVQIGTGSAPLFPLSPFPFGCAFHQNIVREGNTQEGLPPSIFEVKRKNHCGHSA